VILKKSALFHSQSHSLGCYRCFDISYVQILIRKERRIKYNQKGKGCVFFDKKKRRMTEKKTCCVFEQCTGAGYGAVCTLINQSEVVVFVCLRELMAGNLTDKP
jgi:hypothetical protein